MQFRDLQWAQIGLFDECGNIYLDEANVAELHQKYYPLYLNRLNSERGNVEYRKVSRSPEAKFSYHPQVSTKSSTLANLKRDRIINEMRLQSTASVKIDLQQILCYE